MQRKGDSEQFVNPSSNFLPSSAQGSNAPYKNQEKGEKAHTPRSVESFNRALDGLDCINRAPPIDAELFLTQQLFKFSTESCFVIAKPPEDTAELLAIVVLRQE